MSSTEPEEKEEITDLRNPDVVTKYKAAAEIAQNALKKAISECVAGAVIAKVCADTDAYIMEETGKMWKKNKEMMKGIGFPTCISVNHIVGHFSPFADNTTALKAGDVAKIDLGVTLDGYLALVAHTIVVADPAAADATVTGATADVIQAAYTASQLAARLLVKGGSNTAITNAIADVCSDFKVAPVAGVLSHNMAQYVIDGANVIANKEDLEHRTNPVKFDENEVYAIDVVVSTGEGKSKPSDERTTVYKRDPERQISLKVSTARQVLSEVTNKFPVFPFTLRALETKNVNFGIVECVRSDLVEPYPVLTEKAGTIVAQFKFTALLMPSGTMVITGLPLEDKIKSDKAVSKTEYTDLLKVAISDKKKKKKKEKTDGAAAASPESS